MQIDPVHLRQVAEMACRILPGALDRETHRPVEVHSVFVAPGEPPKICLTYSSDGIERPLQWPLDEMDDYLAATLEETAENLASMIRMEVREVVDTGGV